MRSAGFRLLLLLLLSLLMCLAWFPSVASREFRLQHLDSCVTVCTCNEIEATLISTFKVPRAECVGAVIDAVPHDLHPRLVSLDVSYNKIQSLSYMGYTKLEHLNVSNNIIKTISNETFQDSFSLHHLNFSQNRLEELLIFQLRGLAQLVSLDLSFNQIKRIEEGAFEECENLQDLNLSHNQIAKLHPETFRGVRGTLRNLFLSNNLLRSFPTIELMGMVSLRVLDLSLNPLQKLEGTIFSSISTNLSELNLSGCGIYTLGPDVFFSGLSNLRRLDLSNNGLTSLPSGTFRHLSGLEILHIGGNKLAAMSGNNLDSLTNLKVLVLNGSEAEKFELQPGLLAANLQLEELSITNCRHLSPIRGGLSLRHLPELRRVSFRGSSGLAALPASFLPHQQLESLDLTDCGLVCDCGLVWLRELMRSKPTVVQGARCIDAEGTTTDMKDMNTKVLECETDEMSLLTIFSIAAALVFALTTLACGVMMYIRPARYWHSCCNRPWPFRQKERQPFCERISSKDDSKRQDAPESRNFLELTTTEYLQPQDIAGDTDSSTYHIYEEVDPLDAQTSEI